MISKEIIRSKIIEGYSASGVFIVDILISNNNRIIISVDKEAGITIGECTDISKYLLQNLGEEIDDYEVEVSSPGLNKAFKVIEQYRKNRGKQIEIVKKDGIKITGKLQSVAEEFIELEEDVKILPANKEKTGKMRIEFSEIKTAKEVIKIN